MERKTGCSEYRGFCVSRSHGLQLLSALAPDPRFSENVIGTEDPTVMGGTRESSRTVVEFVPFFLKRFCLFAKFFPSFAFSVIHRFFLRKFSVGDRTLDGQVSKHFRTALDQDSFSGRSIIKCIDRIFLIENRHLQVRGSFIFATRFF
jgi:hypothetical protein